MQALRALCLAGGRPLLPTPANATTPGGDDPPQEFGPAVASVRCSLDSGATWVLAAPLPFNASGMAHASVPLEDPAGGERPPADVLVGGWRSDLSQDLLVATYDDPAAGGSGGAGGAPPPPSEAARFLLPTGWLRVGTSVPLIERARPLVAWLPNSRRLAVSGGTVRLQQPGGGEAGGNGSDTAPPLGGEDVLAQPLAGRLLDPWLDAGLDPDSGLDITDAVVVNLLPALAPGGPSAVGASREAELTLPVARAPPRSGVFLLSAAPGVRNDTDLAILLVGGSAYTTLWSPTPDSVQRFFTLRAHRVFGTAAAISNQQPEGRSQAPGSLLGAPLPGVSPRDPWFLLAVEPATGHVFLGTMRDCGQGVLPSPCAEGSATGGISGGGANASLFQTVCRASPTDYECQPCGECPVGTLMISCTRFEGLSCNPCLPCPPGEVPLLPCPLPTSSLDDPFIVRRQQLCAAPGRASVLTLEEQGALWAALGVLAAAHAVAAIAWAALGSGCKGARSGGAAAAESHSAPGTTTLTARVPGGATVSVTLPAGESGVGGRGAASPQGAAAGQRCAPLAWSLLTVAAALGSHALALATMAGPLILLACAAATLSKPGASLTAPRSASEAVMAAVVLTAVGLLPLANAAFLADAARRDPHLSLLTTLSSAGVSAGGAQPPSRLRSAARHAHAAALLLRPSLALRRLRAVTLAADGRAAEVALSMGTPGRRAAARRTLLLLDAALYDAPLAIAGLVYLAFAREVTPTAPWCWSLIIPRWWPTDLRWRRWRRRATLRSWRTRAPCWWRRTPPGG